MDLTSLDDDPVLGAPVRARLFEALVELRRPATTAELAKRLRRHPNGVRLQLQRLADAGLLQLRRVKQARGRPRDEWAIAPGARPGGQPPEAYRQLGRWLARALDAERPGLEGVERTGRDIGREVAPDREAEDTVTGLQDVFTALGFQPTSYRRRGGFRMTLANCPYRAAVRENQPAVCTLHRGLTQGVLDRIDPGATLTGFVPHDPDRAGCLVDVRTHQ